MYNSPIVKKAKAFSKEKHKDQIRKFEQKPYYIHPKRVAHILYQFKVSRNIGKLIAAAYLHDVVEDTDTSIEEIRENFGELVAEVVEELTTDDIKSTELGKKEYLVNKMLQMSSYALTLKLADRVDNVNKIQWTPDNFKDKYIKETYYIIEKLSKRRLTKAQKAMINEIENHLNEITAEEDIDYLSFDSYHKRSEMQNEI